MRTDIIRKWKYGPVIFTTRWCWLMQIRGCGNIGNTSKTLFPNLSKSSLSITSVSVVQLFSQIMKVSLMSFEQNCKRLNNQETCYELSRFAIFQYNMDFLECQPEVTRIFFNKIEVNFILCKILENDPPITACGGSHFFKILWPSTLTYKCENHFFCH